MSDIDFCKTLCENLSPQAQSLFSKNRDGEPHTPCWSGVGKGWHDAIQRALEEIALLVPNANVSQIKEKFGGLRLYVDFDCDDRSISDQVHRVIDSAERWCWSTCEDCGDRQNVKRRSGGWIRTLCDACHKTWHESRIK